MFNIGPTTNNHRAMGVKDFVRLARQRLSGDHSLYKHYPELEYHGGLSQQDGFGMAKPWEHYRVLYYVTLLWLPLAIAVYLFRKCKKYEILSVDERTDKAFNQKGAAVARKAGAHKNKG